MIPTAKLVLLLNALVCFNSVASAPILRREVPQEHSHQATLASVNTSLKLNNPAKIVDAVFALLGDAAAATGQGSITDTDCLQLAVADQAFTNAKAAGDVQGQVDALTFAALERNTGKVGLASVLCTSIKAVNPEIGAITRHQDPASPGAAAINKASTLGLAVQIAAVGGNPIDALKAGTFAPGNLNDNTGKGNTCDDANDPVGCIFSQNLIVDDATPAEISAAVAGGATATAAAGTAAATASATSASATSRPAGATATVTAAAASRTASDVATTVAAVAAAATSAATTDTAAAGGTGAALNFGSCTNPSIQFGLGFDGRTQDSFEPVNQADFNHGSALNIGVITSFICGQLSSACKASAAAITACTAGQTAAAAVTGGAAADAFNAALGIKTTFATTPAGGAAAATTTVVATTAAAAAATTTSAAAAAAAAANTAAVVAGNLQTFTGGLGGITAPAVTQSGSAAQPFCVAGNSCFSSKQNALARSCDVQHNQCADAANASAQKPFSVSDCATQQTTCNP